MCEVQVSWETKHLRVKQMGLHQVGERRLWNNESWRSSYSRRCECTVYRPNHGLLQRWKEGRINWASSCFTQYPISIDHVRKYKRYPANTKKSPNVGLMFAQRRRRWANIKLTLVNVSSFILRYNGPRLVLYPIIYITTGWRRWRSRHVTGWTTLRYKSGIEYYRKYSA